MSLRVLAILNLFFTPTMASEFKWALQITDPTYEVKNVNLTDELYQPYLKRTGWKCQVTATNKKGDSTFRNLNCDFSKYKAGRVSSVLSCSPKRPYGELIFDLYDERKDITFKLMLKCEP